MKWYMDYNFPQPTWYSTFWGSPLCCLFSWDTFHFRWNMPCCPMMRHCWIHKPTQFSTCLTVVKFLSNLGNMMIHSSLIMSSSTSFSSMSAQETSSLFLWNLHPFKVGPPFVTSSPFVHYSVINESLIPIHRQNGKRNKNANGTCFSPNFPTVNLRN